MEPIRTKVCGITNLEDALLAVRLGADALGFNFYPHSPRAVAPDQARRILSALPPFVTTVGVFVNAEPRRVARILEQTGIRVVQLHGEEPPDYCGQIHVPVIKALAVRDAQSLLAVERYKVDAFLLDAPSEEWGGSGRSFDWSLAAPVAERVPVILAGGLRADNVAEAIRTVRPYAVDVCSGVESRPGKKDRAQLTAFLREVQRLALAKG